jgi:hypothetical protein
VSIFKRGGLYQLRRRVPRRYRSIEPRGTIWVSLHTDSETVARSKADQAWSQLTEAWEARLAGDTAAAEKRCEAAQELARIRGFRYLDTGLVSRLLVEALVQRVEAVQDVQGAPDKVEASALLGTVQKPRITVEAALDIYWTLAREKGLGKSEHQVRRWTYNNQRPNMGIGGITPAMSRRQA